MTKVLIIVGSLRKGSFNAQLGKKIEEFFKDRADVSFLEYGDLPYMNQDIEFPTPQAVQRVRKETMSADGIWVITPEYNYSYPGVLKNLLDWLSRPLVQGAQRSETAVYGKPVTISGVAGKSAAEGARTKLCELLGFMGMEVIDEKGTGISLDAEAFTTGVLNPAHTSMEYISQQAEDLLATIEKNRV